MKEKRKTEVTFAFASSHFFFLFFLSLQCAVEEKYKFCYFIMCVLWSFLHPRKFFLSQLELNFMSPLSMAILALKFWILTIANTKKFTQLTHVSTQKLSLHFLEKHELQSKNLNIKFIFRIYVYVALRRL